MNTDLTKAAEIWKKYVLVKNTLIETGVNRSYKSSVGDFAEWLIANNYSVSLPESKSEKGYDVETSDMKIQVKSIAKMKGNTNGYKVSKKDKNNNIATHFAFVYFENLIPKEIYLAPLSYVSEFDKTQIKIGDLRKTDFRLEVNLNVFEEEMPAHNSGS